MLTLEAAPEAPALTARDVTAWWDHRRIHQDHHYSSADLATIFAELAADAMNPENSVELTLSTSPCGILGDYDVLALQHKIAGPILRDLANIGVDFTAIGRTVLCGGGAVATASLGPFTDDSFMEPPKVTIDGSVLSNDWIVSGAGGGALGDSIFGYANDPTGVSGLLESAAVISTIQDPVTAQAAAASRLALSEGSITVEKAPLSPLSAFEISDLIPGALCQVNLSDSCIPVDRFYRLQRVDVSVDGSSGVEAVSVIFQPVGSGVQP